MQDWSPDQLKSHIESGEGVFLKLWKKGCGPCKLSVPAVERVEAKNAHGLVFGQICTSDHPEMVEVAGTEVLPVFFVFKGKEKKGKLEGFKGLKKLESFIDEALA